MRICASADTQYPYAARFGPMPVFSAALPAKKIPKSSFYHCMVAVKLAMGDCTASGNLQQVFIYLTVTYPRCMHDVKDDTSRGSRRTAGCLHGYGCAGSRAIPPPWTPCERLSWRPPTPWSSATPARGPPRKPTRARSPPLL